MLIWDNKWGTIISSSYCEHIIPLVDEYLKENPELIFQQDNAPPHAAKATKRFMDELGLVPIEWPANSPDLNPIQTTWNRMKCNIRSRDAPPRTLSELYEVVFDKWYSITVEEIRAIIDPMPDRIQAVIEAEGGHTPN
jgi:transposase